MLLPDLYKGKIGVDAEEASHVRSCILILFTCHAVVVCLFPCRAGMQLMDDLDFKTATDEITAAAKWLRETGSPKVGHPADCEHDIVLQCLTCTHEMARWVQWGSAWAARSLCWRQSTLASTQLPRSMELLRLSWDM